MFTPNPAIEAALLQYAATVDVTKEPEQWDSPYHGFHSLSWEAEFYGFRVLPLLHRTKIPSLDEWQLRATQDTAQLTAWAEQAPDKWGMGLIPTRMQNGMRRVVLDADTHDAAVFLRSFLGAPDVITAGSAQGAHKGGAHWYTCLRAPVAHLTKEVATVKYGIDIFGADGTEKAQVVGPGSYVDLKKNNEGKWVSVPPGYYHKTDIGMFHDRDTVRYLNARRDTPLDERAPALYQWLMSLAPDTTRRVTATVAGRSYENTDEWQRDTEWRSLLIPDGWTLCNSRTQCGCDAWQHPWNASQPISAIAHEEGCWKSKSNAAGGALHCFSTTAISRCGGSSVSKYAYVANVRYDGNFALAREYEGIPNEIGGTPFLV